jgi:Beta-lactamase class C and other penicillin binding proteins
MKVIRDSRRLFVIISSILIVIFNCFGSTVSAKIQSSGTNGSSQEIAEYIDSEMKQLVGNKSAKGITVSIVQNNKVILGKGYGYADEKAGSRVDPENTVFKIGSVSKIFVALAAMQLKEQGKLDMNTPVSQYLERDFPKFKYPVTMENLLTHTAGFEDLYSPLEVEYEKDILPLKDFIRNYMPNQVFKPGEVSAYSNYGISLAGYVIEKISGMSFYDYTEKYIFEPLQMKHTTYRPTPAGTMSKAYSPVGEEKADVLEHSYPAGSVTSTAEDMGKCMNFLLDDKNQSILGSKEKEDMFDKHFAMDQEWPGYGYVWMRHEINGHVFYEHGGGTANFTSELVLFPEQKLGIFISSNQISNYELAEYSFHVAEMLYGKEQKKAAYTGENTRNISGYYIPARSVFKGSDKFAGSLLNLLSGFPKHITGNPKKGFEMDGEKLVAVGEDRYSLGDASNNIKFIQRGNHLYYSPKQYYTSCIRVPWYEGAQWQLFVILSFMMISLAGFILAAVRAIAGVRKKAEHPVISNLPYIAVFMIFAAMVIRFICYIDYMDKVFGDVNCTAGLAGLIAFNKAAAWLLSISALGGIISTVFSWLKKRNIIVCVFYSIWSAVMIIFTSWLIQMNLLG